MRRSRQVAPALALQIERVLDHARVLAQVARGRIRHLEEQPFRDPALGFKGDTVIVVRGAVVHVVDVRITRERPGLVHVEAVVGLRRVGVAREPHLASEGCHVRHAETGPPPLVLHRRVPLVAVRELQIRIDRDRQRNGRRPRRAAGRKHVGKHDRRRRRIGEGRLLEDERRLGRRQIDRHHVEVETVAAAQDRAPAAERAIGKTDARRDVVACRSAPARATAGRDCWR